MKKEKLTTKRTIPSKAFIQIRWRDQELYRQTKAKKVQHHQTSFETNVKGTSLGHKVKVTTRNEITK